MLPCRDFMKLSYLQHKIEVWTKGSTQQQLSPCVEGVLGALLSGSTRPTLGCAAKGHAHHQSHCIRNILPCQLFTSQSPSCYFLCYPQIENLLVSHKVCSRTPRFSKLSQPLHKHTLPAASKAAVNSTTRINLPPSVRAFPLPCPEVTVLYPCRSSPVPQDRSRLPGRASCPPLLAPSLAPLPATLARGWRGWDGDKNPRLPQGVACPPTSETHQ